MKNDKENGKGKCFMIIPTTLKTRKNFKVYAKGQGCSMQLAANTLFTTAAKKNFRIRTRMRME